MAVRSVTSPGSHSSSRTCGRSLDRLVRSLIALIMLDNMFPYRCDCANISGLADGVHVCACVNACISPLPHSSPKRKKEWKEGVNLLRELPCGTPTAVRRFHHLSSSSRRAFPSPRAVALPFRFPVRALTSSKSSCALLSLRSRYIGTASKSDQDVVGSWRSGLLSLNSKDVVRGRLGNDWRRKRNAVWKCDVEVSGIRGGGN